MIRVENSEVISPEAGKFLYQGKVICWWPKRTIVHHRPSRRSSVSESTKWIIARAEKVGAYQDFENNGSVQRMYVVRMRYDRARFYNKDQLERRVCTDMIMINLGPNAVIDFGTNQKIRGRIKGWIYGIRHDRIDIRMTELSYTRNGHRIKKKGLIPISVKYDKIERIMYHR